MTPQIDNPGKVVLAKHVEQVLLGLFNHYSRFIIYKQFTGGLSGGQVFEIQPIRDDGLPELPAIVKVATISLIEKEWLAYQKHIRHRLHNAATITADPVFLHQEGWGAIRYTLSGGGEFEVVTLRDFLTRPEVSAQNIQQTINHLLRNMHNFWRFHAPNASFSFRDYYDHLLPVNLLIQVRLLKPDEDHVELQAGNIPENYPPQGTAIRLSGFAVNKVDPTTQTVTLQVPKGSSAASQFTLRCRFLEADFPTHYHLNEIVTLFGEVIETRTSWFSKEIKRLFGNQIDPLSKFIQLNEQQATFLYNPIQVVDHLLTYSPGVNVGVIHGDFNLGNILLEPETNQLTLIDFTEARIDHILHDLLRLETEVITLMLPVCLQRTDASPIAAIANLYQHLPISRQPVTPSPEELLPGLQKPWVILNAIRRVIRNYFFDAHDPREFQLGLFLYLLGALKFKNLDTSAKQLAFWGAVITAHSLLDAPDDFDRLLQTLNLSIKQSKEGSTSSILSRIPITHLPYLAPIPRISRMSLSRNPAFVGRQPDLAQMAKTVTERSTLNDERWETLAVTGLGGIGKSQLVCEFVYRYGQFFSGGVFWLSFADPDMVTSEIAACGGRDYLNVTPEYDTLALENQVALVTAEWEQSEPRLLIFDNCETPDLLEKWRPRTGGCRVIVTSRRSYWNQVPQVKTIALNVLDRTSSMNLLRAYYPVAGDSTLEAIADELGDLPLALDMAGRYLARYRSSVNSELYLNQLRDPRHQKTLLEQRIGVSPTGHERNVNRTFAISYERLRADHPIDALARTVLKNAACMAPGEPIPFDLLQLSLQSYTDLLPSDVEANVISRLVELGLIRIEEKNTFRLHRLIAAFVGHEEANIDNYRQSIENLLLREVNRVNQNGHPIELQTWQLHLRYVTDQAQNREDERGIELGEVLATHLFEAGDYEGAQFLIERNITLCHKLKEDQHPLTARNLATLGRIYLRVNRVSQAWACYEQALNIQLNTIGEYHAETAITLNYMGFYLQNQGELPEAQERHTRALSIRTQLYGLHHPATAESLTNLAFIAFRQQNWEITKQNLNQAMDIYRRYLGEQHHKSISVLEYLGEVALAEKKWLEAETIFAQVLENRLQILGEQHPSLALVFDNLGEVTYAQGMLDRSLEYYHRAWTIRHNIFGADHPQTIASQQRIEQFSI